MSWLQPRTPCRLYRALSTYDHTGRRQISDTPVDTKCAAVRFGASVETTSVRTDSTASQGRAEQVVYDAVLLFRTSEQVKNGDVVELYGQRYRIARVQPRPNVMGALHHVQAECDRWD